MSAVLAERSQLSYLLGHLIDNRGKTVTFRSRDPIKSEPIIFYAELPQHFLEQWYPAGFFYITFQVMTLARMSAADQHSVCSQLKGLKYKGRLYPATAHDTDYTHVRRILFPGSACQVSRGIGTPIA
jgi:hypothetical protein